MIEGTVAASNPRCVAQGAVEVLARARKGSPVVNPECQVRGNCRGERATRAVRVTGVDLWRPQVERFVDAAGNVDGLTPPKVPAFDKYDAWTALQDPFAGRAHVVDRF